MKIIGHRGAAGLAPENTIKAIQAGIKAGADAVEFDVRQAKDGVFVLSHDATLERLAESTDNVKNLTLKELKDLKRFDGEPFVTLHEALDACGKTMAIIEAKDDTWSDHLATVLKQYGSDLNATIISFNHPELIAFHKAMPALQCFALERHNAFKVANLAHKNGFAGITLNFWLLNPLTYWFARMRKLEVAIYAVDKALVMRWFNTFYPRVAITTNRPDILKSITK